MLPILLALTFIVLVFVVIIAGSPGDFSISRQTTIAAPPERVFNEVNELRHWESWNPWGNLDPNCKISYSGPAAGVGASYEWSGNNKVGAGRNTITESRPGELVGLRLEFFKPMTATNTATFRFQATGGKTVVAWTLAGKRPGAGKIFGLLINCDKMIGKQFEKGLDQLRSVAEAATHNLAVGA